MTQHRLCPQCGALLPATPSRGLCPNCQRADDQRRNRKRVTSGRASTAWQALRLAALHRDGNRCQHCGQTGTRHTLTIHLRPELGGDHRRASLDDLVTLCRSCHGSTDAARAHTPRFSDTATEAPRHKSSRETLRSGEERGELPSIG